MGDTDPAIAMLHGILALADGGVPRWTAYCWVVVAAAFGAASGFQGIYDRFAADAFALSRTRWGLGYLGVRSLVPAAVFVVALVFALTPMHPALLALMLGVSTEAALRLQFFMKSNEAGDEVNVGIFEFVRRFERIFLDQMREVLSGQRQALATRVAPPGVDFAALCRIVRERIGLSQEDKRLALLAAVDDVEALYAKEAEDGAFDDRYAVTLAIKLAPLVTQQELRRLLAKP